MAPELIKGGEASQQTDLYAFGVMLYEMLAGQPPFAGQDIVSILGQHLHTPAAPPSVHNPTVPPELDEIVLSLLSKNPDDRAPSVL
jgi:serine/threonine protein kinase